MSAKRGKSKNALSVPGLERHGGKYRWRPMVAGKRHTFILQATTDDQAVMEALQLRANPNLYELGAWGQEVEGYLAAEIHRGKLSEATAKNRRINLMRLKDRLEVESPRAVTPVMLERWRDAIVSEHAGKSTSETYIRHAKTFFGFLKGKGRIPMDPAEPLALPKGQKMLRDVFLPSAEVVGLLEAAKAKGDRDLEFILAMGFECGMRRSEISAARPEWFDLKVGVVTVPVTDDRFKRKGREGRRKSATIPLSDPVLEIIGRHGLPSPFVVVPEKTWGDWIYRFDFRKRLANFLEKQGHAELTIHDMRRSFGSNRVSAGVSLEKVANWMGIGRDTAWKHYARFVPADAEINRGAAMKALEKPQESTKGSVADRLRELKGLLADELITPEEFAAKRDGILGDL